MPLSRAAISPGGLSYIAPRNPWLALWWSVLLPGFGHLYLGQNLKGLLLMVLKTLINSRGSINLAIYHTVLGEYAIAKQVLSHEWALLYPLLYLFAMFDAYQHAVQQNHLVTLRQFQPIRRFDRTSISAVGIFTLGRRQPLLAAFWSAAMTGLGQFYCNRLPKAIALLLWYFAVILKSGLGLAAYHTLLDQFD